MLRIPSAPTLASGPTRLSVVVVSPTENQREVDIVKSVVDELNEGFAHERNVQVEFRHWKKNSRPGIHANGPQAIIDHDLKIEESDLVIGIFWRWFGTPVYDAASGTEHEIRRAVAAWTRQGRPDIALYFNSKTIPKGQGNAWQISRLRRFKSAFSNNIFYWEYAGLADFKRQVRRKLTSLLQRHVPFPAEYMEAVAQLTKAGASGVAFGRAGDGQRVFEYQQLRERARRSLLIMGVGMTQLSSHDRGVLEETLARRRSIRLLMLDPMVFRQKKQHGSQAAALDKSFFEAFFQRQSYARELRESFDRLVAFVREQRTRNRGTKIELKVYNQLVPLNVTAIDENSDAQMIMEFCIPFSDLRARFSFENRERDATLTACLNSIEQLWNGARSVA